MVLGGPCRRRPLAERDLHEQPRPTALGQQGEECFDAADGDDARQVADILADKLAVVGG
jgi:hypothetical protein